MPRPAQTHKKPTSSRHPESKKSAWRKILDRMALRKKHKAERAFIKAVNDLYPQWTSKRAANWAIAELLSTQI